MSTEKINIDIKSVISDFENLKNETTTLATSLTQIAKSTKQLDSALTTIAGKQDFTKSLNRIKKINTELLGIQQQAINNKVTEQKLLEIQLKNEEKKLKLKQKQNDEQKKELGAFDLLKQKLQEVEKESKDLLAVINQTKNADKETIALYEKKVKDARELRNAIKDINNEHRATRDIYKENINNQIKINKELEQAENKKKRANEQEQKQENINLRKARGSQLTKENLQAQEQEKYNKQLRETIQLNARVEKQIIGINSQSQATTNLRNRAGALGLSGADIDKANKLNTELLELQKRLEKLRAENKLNTNQYTKASADLDILTQQIKENNKEVGNQIKLANERAKATIKENINLRKARGSQLTKENINLRKARGSQLTKENLQAQEQERYNKKLKETITLNAKVEKQLQAINTQTKATSNLTNKAGALGLSSANIDKVNKLNTELLELQNRLEKLRNENKLNTNQYTKASADLDVLTQKIKDNNREVGEQIKLANQRDKQTAKDNKQNEPYQRLSNELGKLRKEAKNVQAEMFLLERSGQKTSKAYKDLEARSKTLTTQTKTLDSSIKKIDGSLGLHQRNVGNYGSALNGIGRELLGAFGIATGIQLFADLVMGAGQIVLDFSKKQSELQAILGVSSEATASLTAKTLELGSSTVFTASQVTEAAIELAKMGFNLRDVEDSLEGVLNGAVAMGTSIQNSAELSAKTLKAFGLEAKEAERVTSVLALSTARSATDFEYLNIALPYASQGAKQLGFEVEDLTAMLGVLADRGFAASTSGTGLRDIFSDLSAKGLNYSDAMQMLADSTDKSRTAFSLFGKTSMNQAIVLQENADAIEFQRKAISGQEEAMKRMAEVRLDNLAGDITLMKSAWEGFVLSIEKGDGAISGLSRVFIKTSTDILKFFTSLPSQADVLTNELVNINNLTNQITSLNEENEVRAGLLAELNQQYPELLKGLKLEEVTNADLKNILKDVNKEYQDKIRTELIYAETKKLQVKLAEKEIEVAKKRLNLVKELSKYAIRAGLDPSIINENDLEGTIKRLNKIESFREEVNKDLMSQRIFNLMHYYNTEKTELDEIQSEYNETKKGADKVLESIKGTNNELDKTKSKLNDNSYLMTKFAKSIEGARLNAVAQGKEFERMRFFEKGKDGKQIQRDVILNVSTGTIDAEETKNLQDFIKLQEKAIKLNKQTFLFKGDEYDSKTGKARTRKRYFETAEEKLLREQKQARDIAENKRIEIERDREQAEQDRIRRQEEYNRRLLAEKQLNIDILQLRMDLADMVFTQTDDEKTIDDNLQFAQMRKIQADDISRLESDKSITEVNLRKDISPSERAKELEKIDLDLKLKLKNNEIELENEKKRIIEDGLRYKEGVAKNEVEIFKLNNKSRIIDEQYLTEEILRIETERLKSIAELEKDVARERAGFNEQEADRIIANREKEKLETVDKAVELKEQLQKIDDDLIKQQIDNIERLDKIKEEAFERDIQRTQRLYDERLETELKYIDKSQKISEARIDDEWNKMDSALEREKERKLDNEWLTDRGKEDIEKEFDEKSRKLAEDRENQKLVVQQQAEQKRIQIEFDRQMREYDMLQLSFNREKEKEKRAIKNAELQLDLQEQLALAGAKDDEERKKIAKSFADSRSKIAETTKENLTKLDKEYTKDFNTIESLRAETSKQRFIDTLQTGEEFTNKMSSLFAGMYSFVNTLDNKAFEEKQERIEEETGMSEEYAENVLNNKLVFQEKEVENAEKAKQYYIKNEEEKTRATINGIATMSGVVADFFGRQTAAGKAFAIAQATMNTYLAFTNALANTPGPPPIPQIAAGLVLASGLIQVAKIVRTEPPKYAEGTLDAPETKQSITDEEGAELHFDKNWRLRDVGKESGQRMKMVYKGDKIIPADTSKIIKQIMINSAIQNKQESFKFDYDLFANKTAKAINNNSNSTFLLDDGKILKIKEKNGRITIDTTELNRRGYSNQRLVK